MTTEKAATIAQIQEYYRTRAGSGQYATSPDFNLREVEIDYLARWMKDSQRVLDVGCGTGYTVLRHAGMFDSSFLGIDFVPEMVDEARRLAGAFQVKKNVEFHVGDVTRLDAPDGSFDVVVSERCLLNLPTKDDQWRAIREIARVLKPGGRYLMLEGTLQGLRRLNEVRSRFALDPVPEADPSYNWFSNKFDEDEMLPVALASFKTHVHTQRFGMYYLISRVIHPLLIAPASPKYDAPINAIAQQVCSQYPDFEGVGHVALFVFER